jgi:hypothetical protein
VLQRRYSSTTPNYSAGFAGAVPLPLTPNASHTQCTNSSFAELLK